jgi:hypothetical protein
MATVDKALTDSWEDITDDCGPKGTPVARGTPPKSLKSLEKLLWDAQRDKDSLSPSVCSASQSQSISPVSPQSPIYATEVTQSAVDALLASCDFIEQKRQLSSLDWLWDWHQRPDMVTADSNEWQQRLLQKKLQQEPRRPVSVNLINWLEARGFFSKEVLSFLLFSNILSLVIGAGLGYSMLMKRNV